MRQMQKNPVFMGFFFVSSPFCFENNVIGGFDGGKDC